MAKTWKDMPRAFAALERADRLWVKFHCRPGNETLRERAERLQKAIAKRIRANGIYVSN